MNRVRINECPDCGGLLEEHGRFWKCKNCRGIFALRMDDEGNPITYKPIEKKEIAYGKIGQRAAEIKVSQIAVKEIRLRDTIDADVYWESRNLGRSENVRLIITFLENEEWDAAQELINQLLLADYLDAQAGWYVMSCARHARNDNELIRSFSTFTDADAAKLEQIIQNATPKFAKHILDLLMRSAYVGDTPTAKIISVALPYIRNEQLYCAEEYRKKVAFAFDKAISNGYCLTFEYLLATTLRADEVDRYIAYLEKFAKTQTPQIAQKYYSMIIAVDPGNIAAHHNLIHSDIMADAPAEKCISDFETMLSYVEDPDNQVESYIAVLINQQETTSQKSTFMWSLLGYHRNAPECFKNELLRYARILIHSELWVEARMFLNLVLSFDSHNPDAYYGLCLTRMEAKNREELIAKKENLIECAEYKKAIALYQSTGDEEQAKTLMSCSQLQKKKKKDKQLRTRKLIIIISIIVISVSLFLGIKGCSNHRKYSEDNITLTAMDKHYPKNGISDGCHFILDINVKNGSCLAIIRIDGIIRYYNGEGKLLHTSNAWLTGNLEPDKSYNYKLEVQPDETPGTAQLHMTPLSGLKLTWELTQVIYENNEVKEYRSGQEHVIHPITFSPDEQQSQETHNRLTAALKVFEDGEDDAAGYSAEMGAAIEAIVTVLGNDHTGTQFETVYAAAQAYEEQGYYGKASWLYACLSGFGYGDTATMSDRCYDKWVLRDALNRIAEEDDADPQLRNKITAALSTITELYYTSDFAEALMEVVYSEAVALKQKGQYHKAYYLFEELYYAGYPDAALQMEECRQLINN